MHVNTCSDCRHWDWFAVDYGDFPEDDCGACKKNNGEIMYGDEAACDKFYSSGKTNRHINSKRIRCSKTPKKMRSRDFDNWD